MIHFRKIPAAIAFVCGLLISSAVGQTGGSSSPYAAWKNGFPNDSKFFPIAVWLQSPSNAERYKAAGINTYVGLWEGPTEEQLAALKKAGIWLVCEQNAVALRHLDDRTIAGWMHGDEPDNAQELPGGKGYAPPITPQKIADDYQRIVKADPTRPVLLNLGQGVAWDKYIGRDTRTNHPEDYPHYIQGSDIVSFDIYPVVHRDPDVKGKLWIVAGGVQRLKDWSENKKIVWNCIECTHISNPDAKATPKQVRCEVWMSLIHGSQGLIYFVHQFKPAFREAALLDDPEMLKGVTAINAEITSLAPVLNDPVPALQMEVKSENADVPVDALAKNHGGSIYVFAVGMRDGPTTASFALQGLKDGQEVEVIGENRKLSAHDGAFRDAFASWDVHLYRIVAKP